MLKRQTRLPLRYETRDVMQRVVAMGSWVSRLDLARPEQRSTIYSADPPDRVSPCAVGSVRSIGISGTGVP